MGQKNSYHLPLILHALENSSQSQVLGNEIKNKKNGEKKTIHFHYNSDFCLFFKSEPLFPNFTQKYKFIQNEPKEARNK